MLDESVVTTSQSSMSTFPTSPSYRNKDTFLSPNSSSNIRGNSMLSLVSSIAGTETYMAPEVKKHFHAGTKPRKHNDLELFKK